MGGGGSLQGGYGNEMFTGGTPLQQTPAPQKSPFGQRDQFGRVGPFAGRGAGGIYPQGRPNANMFTGGMPLKQDNMFTGGAPLQQPQNDLSQVFQQMFGGSGGLGPFKLY